jgi:acyl-coenzyme A thioesterase PaaI-like protein
MPEMAFQEYYPDNLSHCYGCGRLNDAGLHVQSTWDGEETVCSFTPRSHHTAIPGFVYGGLLASVIDCHSTGSAAAAAYRAENRPMDSSPPIRFVTASLRVDYLRPTPIEGPLLLRSRFKEIARRKVVVETDLYVGSSLCVHGEVVAVRLPDASAESEPGSPFAAAPA